LEAEGNQTYASLDAVYQPMGGVFGRALDAILVERAVQRDVDQMLETMMQQLAPQTMFTQRPGDGGSASTSPPQDGELQLPDAAPG
jgi:hypothetical protein